MEKERVKILGISGSPRVNGNTSTMVKRTLEEAESVGFADTEYLSLADYKLEHCTGCMKCFGWQAPADGEYECYDRNDDIKVIMPKIIECDGLLLGFPIYAYGVPGIFRTFIEKFHGFGPMSFTKYAFGLRYKALGLISQGGQVYGGQELNHAMMSALGSAFGMLVVTSWPTADAPNPESTQVGGILTTVDGSVIYGSEAWTKAGCRTVPPASGSRNERTLKNLGRNLAIGAMIMKLGKSQFFANGFKEPEYISFTRYSVKPKPGSYVDSLIKQGKVHFVSQEELEERKSKKDNKII